MDHNQLREAMIKRILFLLKENNLTIKELSEKSGVPLSTLNDIINNKSKNPHCNNILKIAFGFNMSPSEFFCGDEFNENE